MQGREVVGALVCPRTSQQDVLDSQTREGMRCWHTAQPLQLEKGNFHL